MFHDDASEVVDGVLLTAIVTGQPDGPNLVRGCIGTRRVIDECSNCTSADVLERLRAVHMLSESTAWTGGQLVGSRPGLQELPPHGGGHSEGDGAASSNEED